MDDVRWDTGGWVLLGLTVCIFSVTYMFVGRHQEAAIALTASTRHHSRHIDYSPDFKELVNVCGLPT
jgi:hypothetical protein